MDRLGWSACSAVGISFSDWGSVASKAVVETTRTPVSWLGRLYFDSGTKNRVRMRVKAINPADSQKKLLQPCLIRPSTKFAYY